jgi:hypothetical protein
MRGEPCLRGVRAGDVPALKRFIAALPRASFSHASERHVASYWADPDRPTDHSGLLAAELDGHLVGHAAYIRLYGPRAEAVLQLAERTDKPALAAAMIAALSELADANGIHRFVVSAQLGSLLAEFLNGRLAVPSGATAIEFATAAAEPR